MYSWLPESIRLQTDISPANWVVERLRPWGDRYPQPVATLMPEGFASYARILHPARAYDPFRWIRWSELAADHGVEVTAETTFEQASGFAPQSGPVDGIDEPSDGSMPEHLVAELAEFLHGWTTTPSACWFGMWDGNGTWWKGAHGVIPYSEPEAVLEEWRLEEWQRIDDERDRVLRATPTFGTPQRQYFLMSGPLSAARALTDAAGGSSPNLWWPQDRAWLVSTEVDGFSTYIGGSSSMMDALMVSPTVEAVRTSVNTPIAY
jgi:hypothetical protein